MVNFREYFNLRESAELEARKVELQKEVDDVFKQLQELRKLNSKNYEFTTSDDYVNLRRRFDRLNSELESVLDELEPKATDSIKNPEYINFETIENILRSPRDSKNYTLKTILRNKESQRSVDFLNLRNDVLKKVSELTSNIPSVDIEYLKYVLLTDEENSYKDRAEQFFPVVVEVSATKDDDMGISLLVHFDGNFEMFEGNDEASEETVKMVNKLLNPTGKKVRIYGSHDNSVVLKIKDTGTLPKNLYISPSKSYAEGYADLNGSRSLFTGIININDISQESHVDWKTIDVVKIENVKILN